MKAHWNRLLDSIDALKGRYRPGGWILQPEIQPQGRHRPLRALMMPPVGLHTKRGRSWCKFLGSYLYQAVGSLASLVNLASPRHQQVIAMSANECHEALEALHDGNEI